MNFPGNCEKPKPFPRCLKNLWGRLQGQQKALLCPRFPVALVSCSWLSSQRPNRPRRRFSLPGSPPRDFQRCQEGWQPNSGNNLDFSSKQFCFHRSLDSSAPWAPASCPGGQLSSAAPPWSLACPSLSSHLPIPVQFCCLFCFFTSFRAIQHSQDLPLLRVIYQDIFLIKDNSLPMRNYNASF